MKVIIGIVLICVGTVLVIAMPSLYLVVVGLLLFGVGWSLVSSIINNRK